MATQQSNEYNVIDINSVENIKVYKRYNNTLCDLVVIVKQLEHPEQDKQDKIYFGTIDITKNNLNLLLFNIDNIELIFNSAKANKTIDGIKYDITILNKDDNILLIIKCVPDIINNILAKAKNFIDANASILLPKTHVFTLIEQPQPQHHQLISSKQTQTQSLTHSLTQSQMLYQKTLNSITITPNIKIHRIKIIKIENNALGNYEDPTLNLFLPVYSDNYHNYDEFNKYFNINENQRHNRNERLSRQYHHYQQYTQEKARFIRIKLLEDIDPNIKNFKDYKLYEKTYIELLQYVCKNFFTETANNKPRFLHNKVIHKLLKLDTHYIDNIMFDNDYIVLYVDTSKPTNNRKITYYENIIDFENECDKTKSYTLLNSSSQGHLFEEI